MMTVYGWGKGADKKINTSKKKKKETPAKLSPDW